jgi:transcriptional antiterminator NusG
MNWYVIRVITSKEKKIMELIETELKINNLTDKVSQLLIPSKQASQMRNGKKYSITKNDFPGYILIETDNMEILRSTLKQVNGVIGFLGGKKAEPLKNHEVDSILGRQNEQESEDTYFVGELIHVIDGPFTSFDGDITDVDSKKNSLKVNIKVFGRDVPVDLTFLQVEKPQ